MIKKYITQFREEQDDNKGGGAAVFDQPAKTTTGDLEPPPAKKEEEVIEKKEEETSPAATVDAGALAEKFGNILAERFKPAATEEKKVEELSPEEAKKLLNVFDVSEDWIKKFDNLETRQAALVELRDGFVKHSDTISQFRMKELEKKFEQKFGPIAQHIEETRARETEDRFNKRYEQLASPDIKPLIGSVADGLVKSGVTFKNEQEMFDAIAKGVEKVIQVNSPTFKLSTGSNPGTTKQKTANAIPVTTPGSGGGTGKNGSGEAPTKSRALSVFEK
jgi:ATP-dependent exoDNAse (exonuclease V) beta subunit